MNDWILITSENLPTLPHIASKILSVIGDPLSSTNEFVSVIRMDYSFNQRLLRMFNSNNNGSGTSRLIDTKTAIDKIGLNKAKNLAFIAATKDVISSGGETAVDLWGHSLAVAIGSQLLAEVLDLKPVEEYFFAGLFHDVGKILLNNQKPKRYKELYNMACRQRRSWSDIEKEIFTFTHEEVGVLIMQKWNFPEVLINTAKYHHIFQREDCQSIPDEKTVAIVSTANLIANMLSLGLITSVPTNPMTARSSRIMNISEDNILFVMEKLPDLMEKELNRFKVEIFTTPALQI